MESGEAELKTKTKFIFIRSLVIIQWILIALKMMEMIAVIGKDQNKSTRLSFSKG